MEEFVQTKLALPEPVELSLVEGDGARLIQEARACNPRPLVWKPCGSAARDRARARLNAALPGQVGSLPDRARIQLSLKKIEMPYLPYQLLLMQNDVVLESRRLDVTVRIGLGRVCISGTETPILLANTV